MAAKSKKIKTPRWDLSSIYSSIEGEDYKKAISDMKANFKGLSTQFTKFQSLPKPEAEKEFPHWLLKSLKLQNETGTLYHSLLSYANAAYTTDTTNPLFLNAVSFLEEQGLIFNKLGRQFRSLLTEYAQALPDFYTSFPQKQNYRFLLTKEIQIQRRQMSDAEESLAEDMQRFGSEAWNKLQAQIIANMADAESGKTFNELRNEAYSPDRETRKAAYQKELFLLKQSEIPLAAALNNLKGATASLNKRRNWKTAIDRSLFFCNMNSKTLDALIAAIEDSLPMWRSYLKTKARFLGVKKCAFYDSQAPLLSSSIPNAKAGASLDCLSTEKLWSFAEAKAYIIEKFTSFSDDMGSFALTAFDNNWIDAEVRRGKVGGAYCTEFPQQKVSRILSNFTGTFSDVLTLAHELGHAYHSWCLKDMDYSLSQYPMTLAETASIFAETIVIKDMLAKTEGFERAKLLDLHLLESNQVIVDILSRFYFERSVFEERKTAELTAQDFCRLMAEAQEKTYGSGLSAEKHPYMWAVKSHYYIPSFDYYNFPYAFGLLFALALYSRYEKEGSAFPPIYQNLLQDTGLASCEAVCKKAGFNIETKEFWASGLELFASELKELKKYAPAR